MTDLSEFSDLTEPQIRELLRQKINTHRNARVARYGKTGRAIRLCQDLDRQELQHFRSSLVPEHHPPPRRGSSIWASALLIAEVFLILALGFVIVQGARSLSQSNMEVAQAFMLPAFTSTPIIQAVVIPSGHIPPTSRGASQPNINEIPRHLRPLAEIYASLPTPTPAFEQGIRIRIPAIQVDAPIVQGDGWEQLMKGVGQHIGTANPGQKGNMVLTGHNDVFGEVFRYLDRLKPGDEIIVYSSVRAYTYIVTDWFLVDPSQVEVLAPTSEASITLISCYPYLINTRRIIVKGLLDP
jgi:sortase A